MSCTAVLKPNLGNVVDVENVRQAVQNIFYNIVTVRVELMFLSPDVI